MHRFQGEIIGRLRALGPGKHLAAMGVLYGLTGLVKNANLIIGSRREIGDRLGVSQPTLRKTLDQLERAGAIRHGQHPGLIELNPRLYWMGSESTRVQEAEDWAPEFARARARRRSFAVIQPE